MFNTFTKHSALRWFSALFLLMLFVPRGWAGSTTVVISQVYGGGGSASALYSADYVELFNVSGTAQSLNGLSVQYLSATGTTAALVITLPNISLAPGQRFLIEGPGTCAATGCVTLPTADLTSSLAASGTAGRIYLATGTTALTAVTGSCPTTGVIDAVGYGSTAVCAEGNHPAPATTTTTVAVRTNPCTDTDDNAADFTGVLTTATTPRTMSSTPTPCSVSSGISATGKATPASVYQGASTVLAVTVTPGAGSTGVAVTANLLAFGGSSTQALLDNGLNGDATAGDGIYSYTLAVPGSAPLGANTIVASASDAQAHTATANIAVTVLAPVTLRPIHQIQGNVPGTAAYVGQTVMTSGIITGVTANGFYLQAKDSDADTDPATPEGIFVHTGTGLVPSNATLKTEMQVTGLVSLYPAVATTTLPGTELDNPTAFTVLSTGNALPTPITLTTTNPSPSGGFAQLQRYQSMRVTVPSFTVTGPTEGVLTETAETYVSDGQFWGTVTGVPRPVREPGLEVLDVSTATRPSTIPRFDDNPEVFEVDSIAMLPSGAPLDLATGAVLTGMTGVMDFSGGAPLFIIDTAAATARPTATGGMTPLAASAALPGELTIGDQNLERFYDVAKETTGAIAVTQAAYNLRLAKASLEIRNLMHSPDIMAIEEMENIQTLNTLAAQISTDAIAAGQTDPQYVGYLVNGNDSSGINVAFLVNPNKITVTDVTQVGKTTTETGTTTLLNDRPPLVLRAGIKRSGTSDYPLTIIVNHLRSLNSITDDTSTDSNARNKREQQAEFLANLVQQHQAAGEHVVVLGDLNTFEFNDGLVDSFGILKGNAAPANQDVLAGTTGLVTPNLVDAAPTNLATSTYTYNYAGNAQSIDHFLTTADIAGITRTSPVHVNADFPVILRNDVTIPQGGSDHDGIVGYIKIPGTTQITLTPATLTFGTQVLNTPSATQAVTVANTGTTAITITSIVASTGFSQTNTCGTSLAGGSNCVVTVTFKPTVTGPITGTITLTDSDVLGTQTIGLTGTGAGIFSSTALIVSPTNILFGASDTFTATVTGNAGTTPTGTVNFLDGTTVLKSGATMTGGIATFATTTLAVGTHSITAVYSGDATYPTSTSTASTVVVTAPPVPGFSFSISNTQIIATQFATTATTTANVAMVNGFSSPVSFSCSGLPAASRCTFAPATLSASGSSTLSVTINTSSAAMHSPFGGMRGVEGVMACGLLALPFFLRRKTRSAVRRAATLMTLLLLAGGLTALSGCGGGGAASTTPAGSSTVTVTATGGSVTHTASFTMVVQ